MLFKRRERQGYWERLKVWLWPRVSWRRSTAYYIKRVLRLSGTPQAIAMGTAVGVAVAFTPLLGLHILAAVAVAWVLRGNLMAAALGTFAGNPLTFPFIWASSYELGHFLLDGVSRGAPTGLEHDLTHRSADQILPLIKPMLVGAVPLGLIAGTVAYFLIYKAVAAYQAARRVRLERHQGGKPAVAELVESRPGS